MRWRRFVVLAVVVLATGGGCGGGDGGGEENDAGITGRTDADARGAGRGGAGMAGQGGAAGTADAGSGGSDAAAPDAPAAAAGGEPGAIDAATEDAAGPDGPAVPTGLPRLVPCGALGTSSIDAFAYAADGSVLAVARSGASVELWTPEGEVTRALIGAPGESWRAVALSKGGRVAGASATRAYVWNVADGRIVATLALPATTNALVFADDAHLAAAGEDGIVYLLAVAGEAGPKKLEGHAGAVKALAVAADGTLASGGEDKTLRLWAPGGSPGAVLTTAAAVRALAFSATGERIALGDALGNTGIVDVATQMVVTRPAATPQSGAVRSVAFTPDDKKVISVSGQGAALVIRARDGAVVQQLAGQTANWAWSAVSASPKGIAAIAGGILWVGDARFEHLSTNATSTWATAVSADASVIATAGDDRVVRLWESDGTLRQALSGHTATVSDVTFSADGTLLASVSWDHTVRLWRVSDGAPLGTLTGLVDLGTGVSFAPDGSEVVGIDNSGLVIRWRTSDGMRIASFTEPGHCESIAHSPDGTKLAVGCREKARLVDRATTNVLQEISFGSVASQGVAFSSDGTRWAAGEAAGAIQVKSVADGSVVADLKLPSSVEAIAFTGNDTQIAAAVLLQGASVVDLTTKQVVAKTTVSSSGFEMAATRDGSMLVVGGNTEALIWRPNAPAKSRFVRGMPGSVQAIAFARDKLIVGVRNDSSRNSGWMWDVTTGAFTKLPPEGDGDNTVAGSSDGTRYALGGDFYAPTIRVGALPSTEAVASIKPATVQTAIALSADGKRVAGSVNADVSVWSVDDQMLVKQWSVAGGAGNLWWVGNNLLVGHGQAPALFDASTGAPTGPALPSGTVYAVSNTGVAAIKLEDQRIVFVGLDDGRERSSTSGQFITAVTFSADGRYAWLRSTGLVPVRIEDGARGDAVGEREIGYRIVAAPSGAVAHYTESRVALDCAAP